MNKEILLLSATALFLAGGALAQPSATTQGSATTQADAAASAGRDSTQVTGQSEAAGQVAAEGAAQRASGQFAQGTEIDATLERPVDARRASVGDEVRATLNESVRSEDGVVIEQGATVVGRVTAATRHQRATRAREGAASTLAIVFDKAVLRDGRELPMSATIQAIAAARSATDAGVDAGDFGRADARSRSSGQGSARGGAAPAGGIGSAGGIAGGVAGGAGATAGGIAGGVAGAATGTAGAAAGGAGRATGSAVRAGGGLDASGRFVAGTRGAFGMDGIEIAGQASGSAQASVIRSDSGNVRLDSGTRLLLVTEASASGR
jgi:hypothetical protein